MAKSLPNLGAFEAGLRAGALAQRRLPLQEGLESLAMGLGTLAVRKLVDELQRGDREEAIRFKLRTDNFLPTKEAVKLVPGLTETDIAGFNPRGLPPKELWVKKSELGDQIQSRLLPAGLSPRGGLMVQERLPPGVEGPLLPSREATMFEHALPGPKEVADIERARLTSQGAMERAQFIQGQLNYFWETNYG